MHVRLIATFGLALLLDSLLPSGTHVSAQDAPLMEPLATVRLVRDDGGMLCPEAALEHRLEAVLDRDATAVDDADLVAHWSLARESDGPLAVGPLVMAELTVDPRVSLRLAGVWWPEQDVQGGGETARIGAYSAHLAVCARPWADATLAVDGCLGLQGGAVVAEGTTLAISRRALAPLVGLDVGVRGDGTFARPVGSRPLERSPFCASRDIAIRVRNHGLAGTCGGGGAGVGVAAAGHAAQAALASA